MASCTRVLKARRAMSKRRRGKERKNAARREGTTVKNLPLDKPTANELAQAKAKA